MACKSHLNKVVKFFFFKCRYSSGQKGSKSGQAETMNVPYDLLAALEYSVSLTNKDTRLRCDTKTKQIGCLKRLTKTSSYR